MQVKVKRILQPKRWDCKLLLNFFKNLIVALLNHIRQNMSNDQKLPWAEIKAGLKLAKEAYEVLVNDTDYVKGIRLHLERIDAALQSGNLDIILHCNGLVTNEYKNLLVSNNVRFASQSTLREKGFYWNFINLRDIGQLLYHEIYKDKIIEGTIALLAISCEYICDKIADSRAQRKSNIVHQQEQHL